MSKVQMVLLASNDYQTDLNTANELYCIVNKQFQIGALGHYDEEIEALKKVGVDFVYDCYAQLGREFAGEFLEFLENESV